MRVVYFLFFVSLCWSYWKALARLRGQIRPLSPIFGWMVGLGFFTLIPLGLLVANGGYKIPALYQANDSYSSVDLTSARFLIPMIVIWLALLFSFQVVMIMTRKRVPIEIDQELTGKALQKVLFVTFGLALLDYAFEIRSLGGLEAFLISHWYYRQEEMFARFGDAYVLYAHLSLANHIVFTAAAALHTANQLKDRKINWGFSALIIIALLLQMIMSGNRIFIALYGLAFLLSCWIYRRKKILWALAVVSPAVLLIFSAWASLRHNLGTIAEDAPTYLQSDFENQVMATLMDSTEGVSIMQLIHTIDDFGRKFDYFYGLSYSKAVTFLVPRSLYPNKPENFPVLIARLYEPGELTSLGTTQLGELYANFGGLSVLLLPIMTALTLFLSRTRTIRNHVLMSAALFLLFIWCTLTSFEDNFITFLCVLLLIYVLRFQGKISMPLRANQLRPA